MSTTFLPPIPDSAKGLAPSCTTCGAEDPTGLCCTTYGECACGCGLNAAWVAQYKRHTLAPQSKG